MKAAKLKTEAEMLDLLRARYSEQHGNGEAWAFVTHVRNAAGFDASRTCDAIAMALWPSRGLVLHGIEVKCSRSDWLRELKAPAKAETFAGLVDRWYLAIADRTIVRVGELPEGWGLLVARGNRLVQETEAQPLHEGDGPLKNRPLPAGLNRSALAALLRSACRQADATPAEVDAARETERQHWADRVDRANEEARAVRVVITRFERESGVRLTTWAGTLDDAERDRVAHALRLTLTGEQDTDRLQARLERLRDDAYAVAVAAERALAPPPLNPSPATDDIPF